MTTAYWSDFVPTSTFYRILRGFLIPFAAGVACRQGTLTIPDTWSPPFGTCICSTCWDQSFFRTCRYFPGLCSSNIPRYFLEFAWHIYTVYPFLLYISISGSSTPLTSTVKDNSCDWPFYSPIQTFLEHWGLYDGPCQNLLIGDRVLIFAPSNCMLGLLQPFDLSFRSTACRYVFLISFYHLRNVCSYFITSPLWVAVVSSSL